jgi:hypothetical protein
LIEFIIFYLHFCDGFVFLISDDVLLFIFINFVFHIIQSRGSVWIEIITFGNWQKCRTSTRKQNESRRGLQRSRSNNSMRIIWIGSKSTTNQFSIYFINTSLIFINFVSLLLIVYYLIAYFTYRSSSLTIFTFSQPSGGSRVKNLFILGLELKSTWFESLIGTVSVKD